MAPAVARGSARRIAGLKLPQTLAEAVETDSRTATGSVPNLQTGSPASSKGRALFRPMTRSTLIGGVVAALLVGGAAIAWRPAIAATDPPAPQSFNPEIVKRGRELAAIGNCSDCHTVAGGKSLAGGLPVSTPFGKIFSINITPDPETGIGRWSEADFRR